MAGLFGHLNLQDSERGFVIVQGQLLMFRETEMIFARWNEDLNDALSLFVEQTTDAFKERYKLPGNGYLQGESVNPAAPSAAVKASGSYDVTYPLRQYGASLAYSDVALGYLTPAEYTNDVQTVLNQNNNTIFKDVLYAIFNNSPPSYLDPVHGSLTLVPLANGDSTKYPPVFGSVTEATENLYLAPNYTESQISNTNNPYATIRDTLEPHWGFPQGGSPIMALCNTSAVSTTKLLAGFDEFPNRYVNYGANVSLGDNDLPPHPAGGRIIGSTDGVVVVEWPRIPSGWIVGIHLDAPRPLKRRKDPGDTGLSVGLQLIAQDMDYPFRDMAWRHRVGFGVGNRLSACVVALNGTSSYSIPTLYQ